MTANLHRLLEIMARLRDPETGCPWDVEQSFATIAPYTIEEAYEVADAIERGDVPALRDELGDLLFQVVFHARMAEEQGHFAFDDVAGGISDKMLRRHPHVFGTAEARTAGMQRGAWEEQKAEERAAAAPNAAGSSALDGVALALPALMRAEKLARRAARVGFDWPTTEAVFEKLEEELGELRQAVTEQEGAARIAEEMGDLLFAVANLSRHLGVDSEVALRAANAKFERRFRHIERALAAEGRVPADATLAEMEAHWVAAKRQEKGEA
ncbi:MAG: nucleoside triphosphate pyrophosphohydrolase [Alphaproteobacteria bacterium]